jgi:flagellar protein FlaJ
MALNKVHWIGIAVGVIILAVGALFFLRDNLNLFLFLTGIAFLAALLPFLIDLAIESKKDEEINEMFLEFTRNLAESVNTGTPISKSIVNMSNKNYGVLSEHIKKLSNQIELGIPVHMALKNFANDVDNEVISRAIALIMEAERAGGEIDYILESTAKSISEVEKIKKERKSAVYGLVVQGYIIFFVFIGIMLVMQYKILPLTSGLQGISGFSMTSLTQETKPVTQMSIQSISNQFLYLLVVQGFFAGLIIGKLGEGNIKAGLKHSAILTIASFLIATGARTIFG